MTVICRRRIRIHLVNAGFSKMKAVQTHHEDGKRKAQAQDNAIAIALAQWSGGRARHDASTQGAVILQAEGWLERARS